MNISSHAPTSKRLRWFILIGWVVLFSFGMGALLVAHADTEDFNIVLFPDTQNESASYPSVYAAQTTWIANNKTTQNIVFASHLGDIVLDSGSATQWENADTAMDILDAGNVFYSVGPGNHDLNGLYNDYFGYARFSGKPWYGGHYGSDNYNNYSLFSASGLDFILINLQWNPSTAMLNWADALLKQYSARRGIVISHEILTTGGSLSSVGTPIFNALKDNPNLFIMLCGHAGVAYLDASGDDGHTIHIMEADYEGKRNGGNGYLRILTFSPVNNVIHATTYSPYDNTSITTYPDTMDMAYDMHGGTPTMTKTASMTPTRTQTPTKTNTPTASATRTFTPTATYTFTPTVTYTPSMTDTPTETGTPTHTATVTWTATQTASITPTLTASMTDTPTETGTPTHTATVTSTPTTTLTPTITDTPTITNTPTVTWTHTQTASITPTLTASMTYTPSLTKTRTMTATPTSTSTMTRTRTSTATKTATRTATSTFTPTQATYILTVISDHGTVNRDNPGPYHTGDVVKLTAASHTGWNFSNWSGDATGTTNPALVTINGNKTVTANYTRSRYLLFIPMIMSYGNRNLPPDGREGIFAGMPEVKEAASGIIPSPWLYRKR